MNPIARHLIAVAVLALCATGCDDNTPAESPPPTGTLHAGLAFSGSTHDVVAMHYRVVAADADCDDEAIDEAISPLEEEALPLWLTEGDNHAFSDALFVLQPGDYKVCVTPIQEDGSPSAVCASAEGVFTVLAEETTEGVIYAQCLGDPSGGLDVIAALNDPPHIDDLDILESKFITTCEAALITVTASDPNGDALTYAWEITGAPDGANPQLAFEGNQAQFSSDVEGPYQITVTVDDGLGGEAHLSFPIHVSFEDCEPPCEDQCVVLAEQVLGFCLDVIGDLIPEGGEAFCRQAAALTLGNCNPQFCPDPPDDCRAACQQVAADTVEQCLPLSPDPAICEGGGQVVFDLCVEVFQCPPPALPCPDQCVVDANALFDACANGPAPDPLICLDAPEPQLQACFVEAQGQFVECLYAPDGCFPPEQRDCALDCSAEAAAGGVECAGEPRCEDPGACNFEIQQNDQACQEQCCFNDCLENQCAPRCMGDQECMQECARVECQPQCFPEPSCEEACGDAANQVIADCLGDRPPEPICVDSPDNDCVALGYEAFIGCVEGQCEGDACGARCVGECIAGCNPIDACQGDPALTAECQAGCAPPPPPPCEDQCIADAERCLEAGIDPLECERGQDACFFFCGEPDCLEICGFELTRCIDGGGDPVQCFGAAEACSAACEEPPPPPDPCFEDCELRLQDCLAQGNDPAICEAEVETCLASCEQ